MNSLKEKTAKEQRGSGTIFLSLFLAVLLGFLLLLLSEKRVGTDNTSQNVSDSSIFESATATDPYLRSLQGAQEARFRMDNNTIQINQELK